LAYIVNNDGGGWTIVSATKDYYPILAYSDKNNLILDRSNINLGLEIWLDETIRAIESSKNINSQTSSQIAMEWLKYTPEEQRGQRANILPGNSPEAIMCRNRLKELNETYYNDGWSFMPLSASTITLPNQVYNTANQYGSPYIYTIVGIKDVSQYVKVEPLLTTKWGQTDGYNDLCPDNAKAGCVPIAMAQIMNFHRYPSSFDWENMENDKPTYASQYLIADIGETIDVNYGSDSSSADISDAKEGFNFYGYNVTRKEHRSHEVAFEIGHFKRPVYMRGQKGFLRNGHAWVCDGVIQNIAEYQYYVEYINNGSYDNLGETFMDLPGQCGGQSYVFFHMNWGWKGVHDGWYITATPSDKNYEYDRENLYVSVNKNNR